MRDPGASDDVVQGAYLSALQRRRNGGRVGVGWLRAVVRSRSVDVRRQQQRSPEASSIDDAATEGATRAPDEILEQLETQRELLRLLADLGEPYREAVYLRYFEGLGPSKIARRLGVPVKTVDSRIERGLHKLRARVRGAGGDGHDLRAGLFALAGGLPRVGSFPPEWPIRPESLAPRSAAATLLTMKATLLATAVALACFTTWFFLHGAPAPRDADRVVSVDVASNGGESLALPEPAGDAVERVAAVTVSPVEDHAASDLAEVSDAPATGALEVAVKWSTGEAAANVSVVASTPAPGSYRGWSQRRITGADGIARFEGLNAGTVELRIDRGAKEKWGLWPGKPEVLAGEVTRFEVLLGQGVDVVGQVTTADGSAVPGALIWQTGPSLGWTAGRVVATADAGGAFTLRDVLEGESLGAFVDGRAPGELVDLDQVETSTGAARLTLVVGAPCGAIAGTVRNGEGEPIEDALVVLGEWTGRIDVRADFSVAERWTPLSCRSAADGSFRFGSVAEGAHNVRIRHDDFAVWMDEVEVSPQNDARIEAALLQAAAVEGVVTDSRGAPVPRATIHAFERSLSETYLQTGQIDYDSPFVHPVTASAEDGTFRLSGVPPGAVWIYAQDEIPDPGRGESTVLFAKTQLQPAPGSVVRWDPVLDPGRTIEGVARYNDGTPIKNVFVSADEVGGEHGSDRALHTADGTFQFIQLDGERYDLWVQVWDPPPGAKRVEKFGVAPGGGPIEIVANFGPPTKHEPATVLARFEDAGGRATTPSSIGLTLECQSPVSWAPGEKEDGTWRFKVRKPGTYRLLAFAADRLIASGEPFEVEAGATHDLGTLRSKPGGTVVLRFAMDEGVSQDDITISLRSESCKRWERLKLDGSDELRLEGVEPGPAHLSIRGKTVATLTEELVVASDREATLDVRLRAAVGVPYRVSWTGADEPGRTTIRFLNRADGSEVRTINMRNANDYPNPLEWTFRAGIGEYTFLIEQSNGKSARRDFDVRSLNPDDAPRLDVDLR